MTKETESSPMNVYRYLRSIRGLSRQEVADAAGVCALTVFSLEHGRPPLLGSIQKLAAFYGVTLDCLARNDIASAAKQVYSTTLRGGKIKSAFREKQQKCDRLGDLGEKLVLEHEQERLAGTPFADAVNGKISEDMAAGYDILSFKEEGKPVYIEVKATSYSETAPFYMSRKEYRFLQQCAEDGTEYQLHRVFDLNENGDHKVHVLTAQELLEHYVFIPSTYLVRRASK
jgi:transcriptional regulator with XRE-family HTH domain